MCVCIYVYIGEKQTHIHTLSLSLSLSLSLTHTHSLTHSLTHTHTHSLSHTQTHIKLPVYRKQLNYVTQRPSPGTNPPGLPGAPLPAHTVQLKYLNLAMMHFGASEVVPVYYVLFTYFVFLNSKEVWKLKLLFWRLRSFTRAVSRGCFPPLVRVC